jgi:hypothetical protein
VGVFGLEAGRVGFHHLVEQSRVQRAPVHPDAHWLAVLHSHLTHGAEVGILLLALAYRAGIDAVLVQGQRHLGVFAQQYMAVEVKIAHQGHIHPQVGQAALDLRYSLGSFIVVDGHAHDFGAGTGKGPNLPHRGLDVGGIGVGHGLHHHRVVAPFGDFAHPDGWSFATLHCHTNESNILWPGR